MTETETFDHMLLVHKLTPELTSECDLCELPATVYIALEPGELPQHKDTLFLCEKCLLQETATVAPNEHMEQLNHLLNGLTAGEWETFCRALEEEETIMEGGQ